MKIVTCAFALLAAWSARATPQGQAGQTMVYVALGGQNEVLVFAGRDARTPSGTLTQGIVGPTALAVDGGGTLYVANSNKSITAYALGATSPTRTYTNGVGHVGYLAVQADGTLFASNTDLNTVVEYPSGSTTPNRTIAFGDQPQSGIAVDASGNLYVLTYFANVERFAPGKTHGIYEGVNATGSTPNSLFLDTNGNFLIGPEVFGHARPHPVLRGYTAPAIPSAFYLTSASLFAYDSALGNVIRMAYPGGNFANIISNLPAPASAVAAGP